VARGNKTVLTTMDVAVLTPATSRAEAMTYWALNPQGVQGARSHSAGHRGGFLQVHCGDLKTALKAGCGGLAERNG
jgi:hypothetical protein